MVSRRLSARETAQSILRRTTRTVRAGSPGHPAHPIDRAAGILFDLGIGRAFVDGWGDEALVALLSSPLPDEPAPIQPTVTLQRTVGDLVFSDGSFSSPGVGLPTESREARFLKVDPADGPRGTVVLMAAWGEHSPLRRLGLSRLLSRAGLSSIILENPYYGSRRPCSGQVIRTVADFSVMGRAAVEEARSLLAWLTPSGPVGVSGFSMGGNMAALAGASMPTPVAIAPLAPSPSPGPVWTEGIISRSVAWKALGEDGRPRLGAVLGAASVLTMPPKPHTRHAVLVGASADGYIPRDATVSLHRHWPGSELRWIDAGHGTLIWRHKQALARAVVDSFDRVREG